MLSRFPAEKPLCFKQGVPATFLVNSAELARGAAIALRPNNRLQTLPSSGIASSMNTCKGKRAVCAACNTPDHVGPLLVQAAVRAHSSTTKLSANMANGGTTYDEE
eukprot:2683926-Amphidinium_carterae.2